MLSVVARHVPATRARVGMRAITAAQATSRLRPATATVRARSSTARKKRNSDDKHTSKSETDSSSPNQDQNQSQESRSWIPRTLSVLIPLVPIAIVLWELIGLEIVWVAGPSMAPYLNDQYGRTSLRKDRVLVRRVGADTPLERGMVVLFRSLVDPSRISVKRIIGLPGDRVSPRVASSRTPASSASPSSPTIIPWNHLWLEGDADDSRVSMDSNAYGPISRNVVVGRAVAVLNWSGTRKLRWQDWEGQNQGQDGADRRDEGEEEQRAGGEGEERMGWRQRRRVEKGAVDVREPVTF